MQDSSLVPEKKFPISTCLNRNTTLAYYIAKHSQGSMASGVAESRCSKVFSKTKTFSFFLLAVLWSMGTSLLDCCLLAKQMLRAPTLTIFFSDYLRKNISFLFLFLLPPPPQKLSVLALNEPAWVKCYIPISIASRKPFLCSMFIQIEKLGK